MLKHFKILLVILLSIIFISSTVFADSSEAPLTRDQFNLWPQWPEYTVFNFFPSKGRNCTWYVHGRMIQLGYCKYALDSMRFNANTWAERADRGAVVTDQPERGVIAFWEGGVYFGSALGHVAVVEAVLDNGSILISESSSSASVYNTRLISPGDAIWPTAFIVVPAGQDKSVKFTPGEYVRVKADNLNFRVEGVNQTPILLAKNTVIKIKEHSSNGLFSSQPGSITSYHYWWYAEYDTGEELIKGWVAETYLETAGSFDPGSTREEEPVTNPPLDQDTVQEEDQEPVTESEPQVFPGDVIGNGRIDVRDVTFVMQYILNVRELEPEQLTAADVNDDGLVDIKDVSLIMRHVLGINKLA